MDDSTTPTPLAAPARKAFPPRWLIVLWIALAVIGVAVIYGPGLYNQQKSVVTTGATTPASTAVPANYCNKDEVKAAAGKIADIFIVWSDAYAVANATGRGNLFIPIASLQAIRRDLQAVEVPLCMNIVKKDAILSMNSAIDGFFAFVKEASDTTVNSYFKDATAFLKASNDGMARIMACAPDCP
jgi:hypothetical protein